MKNKELKELEYWYSKNLQNKLKGRWITLKDITPILKKMPSIFKATPIGTSFLNRNIYSVTFGQGKEKILIWTQMHGNESTGTRALFDLFNLFSTKNVFSTKIASILNAYTIVCIPMLNPDGAEVYSRLNAQKIDLNRDVIDKKANESRLLQKILKQVNPTYCFNMHDQRTIFSVGIENNPATISFLAPSEDIERTVTEGRKATMKIIVEMDQLLQKVIPKQIGRYTDEFYPTATGDNFQKMGHNTILIESGHFKDDYRREHTRKYTFFALFQGICSIVSRNEASNYKDYFNIPNNDKNYLDVVLKNVTYKNERTDVGILYVEKIMDNKLCFSPTIEKLGNLSDYNANDTVTQSNLVFLNEKELIQWVENKFN